MLDGSILRFFSWGPQNFELLGEVDIARDFVSAVKSSSGDRIVAFDDNNAAVVNIFDFSGNLIEDQDDLVTPVLTEIYSEDGHNIAEIEMSARGNIWNRETLDIETIRDLENNLSAEQIKTLHNERIRFFAF